jgi:hypothetical protein
MIVAIYKKSSDTCGNTDYAFLGYYECNSVEEAEKQFPETNFVGYEVVEVKPVSKKVIEEKYASTRV